MKKMTNILNGVKILSTDPDRRIGVYAIRYLGQAGAIVDSLGIKTQKHEPMGFYSKYLSGRIYYDQNDYSDEFRRIIIKNHSNYDVINPIEVSKMLNVIEIEEELKLNLKYLLPHKEQLKLSDNKETIIRHAEKVGVPCPKTRTRVEVEDLADPGKLGLTFPCIIKFRGDSRMTHWRPEERYRIIYQHKDLVREYIQMHAIEEYPVIQEYIDGVGVGFFALYDKDKRLKAQFCHQRIREYPISGGPSSCCKSIYDKELIRHGRTLLESLDWMGLAMVEFKYDKNRNQFYLLEVNPRYWGSLPLAVYSGVNFPVLHIMSILGLPYDPILKYKVGMKMRFIDRDIKAILLGITHKNKWKNNLCSLIDLFNPFIKEGFLTMDDIGFLLKVVQTKI